MKRIGSKLASIIDIEYRNRKKYQERRDHIEPETTKILWWVLKRW